MGTFSGGNQKGTEDRLDEVKELMKQSSTQNNLLVILNIIVLILVIVQILIMKKIL